MSTFFGRDGYKRSVPLERALADGILATHLNSRPLTLHHGAPWRAVLPGWYGMDSVKWLERIVVAAAALPPEGGTYQQSRQTSSGELDRQPLPRVQVKSVITDPQQGAVLQARKSGNSRSRLVRGGEGGICRGERRRRQHMAYGDVDRRHGSWVGRVGGFPGN